MNYDIENAIRNNLPEMVAKEMLEFLNKAEETEGELDQLKHAHAILTEEYEKLEELNKQQTVLIKDYEEDERRIVERSNELELQEFDLLKRETALRATLAEAKVAALEIQCDTIERLVSKVFGHKVSKSAVTPMPGNLQYPTYSKD